VDCGATSCVFYEIWGYKRHSRANHLRDSYKIFQVYEQFMANQLFKFGDMRERVPSVTSFNVSVSPSGETKRWIPKVFEVQK